MGFLRSAVLAALLSAPALAADAQAKCGPNQLCPESAPCCSPYGLCGVGAYCLGGCDPRFSHSIKACAPAPVCKDSTWKMDTLDGVQDISKYLGDASKADWSVSGKPLTYNGATLLTMPADSPGTLLSSTHYVWYGKVEASIQTSRGAGVVTAFIFMSDTKDEIDYEWVGVDLQNSQTNYYAQGYLDYTHGKNVSSSNTDTQTHKYGIDWTQDQITWLVDDKALRTVKKSDTWNSTTNRFDFPQTPSRVQLSLWPAGLPSNGQGTIDWAGGLVDWNKANSANGYYYASVKDISVKCYDPPSGAQKSGSKSYIYTDTKATNQSIKITDDSVVLKSLFATGENPDINPNGDKSSSSGNSSVNTVPGVSGIGTRGNVPGAVGSSGSDSSSGSASGFSQNMPKSGAGSVQERFVKSGSSFGALVALVLVFAWL